MPNFWLLKCEPEVYSIADLARDGKTGWDGVRNYQVRNFMRDTMKPGDLGVFYHSNADPSGAAGILEIRRTALADPTQFDPGSDGHDPKSDPKAPTWLMCEVGFVEAFRGVIPLEQLRAEKALAGMQILQRGNRLSITPVTEAEFTHIRRLGAGGSAPAPVSAPVWAPESAPASASGAKVAGATRVGRKPVLTAAKPSRAKSTR